MENSLDGLLDEVRLLSAIIETERDRLLARAAVTKGMRDVLEVLRREGPLPVPGIARARRVSRQHVQGLVNRLSAMELVELVANPRHRRSPLVRLTTSGRAAAVRVREQERRRVERLGTAASTARLAAATSTLRTVRRALSDT